tara:strand:- start:523 stop:897 length:375 start_codon:yes stop_codon:yes gene_type:complete
MKSGIILGGVGLIIGLTIGVGITWYFTNDFTTQAIVEAELRFNQLLEEEKAKFSEEIGAITELKENLESTLVSTETAIDSLNTTIHTRSKELNQIKRKYNEKISSIDGMSHNDLTNFFSKRYGN